MGLLCWCVFCVCWGGGDSGVWWVCLGVFFVYFFIEKSNNSIIHHVEFG